jgi:hypothetical protein
VCDADGVVVLLESVFADAKVYLFFPFCYIFLPDASDAVVSDSRQTGEIPTYLLGISRFFTFAAIPAY